MRLHKVSFLIVYILVTIIVSCQPKTTAEEEPPKKPNILFAISDDQSYPHASAYGYKAINTPAFDRVAKEGLLFNNAFSASPGCSPSRAAILTGRNCWQLEQAGTHASSFPTKYITYTDLLDSAGYHVGYTGKGWSPGNYKVSGRTRNPAGDDYQDAKLESPEGISDIDYAANFRKFMEERQPDQPFCFWYGATEPHRVFKKGIGLENGKKLEDVEVPEFLPDTPEIRSDILDYCYEIEWFDKHLGQMLQTLEEMGELENTIIIVTSDNGMAFPRAKANAYEYGIHMPLAIRWGTGIAAPGRTIDDLVSLTDVAPTILEATHIEHTNEEYPMVGKSLINIFTAESEGDTNYEREAVFSARERHSSSRWNNLTYPQRSMRTPEYLYIRNFKPNRWPAGAPQKYEKDSTLGPMHDAYHDIDACPTLTFLVENRENPDIAPYFHMAVDKRPYEELYNIKEDPYCLNNLIDAPTMQEEKIGLIQMFENYLNETDDPRIKGEGDIYEEYIRYSSIRSFPEKYAPDED